MIVIHQAWVRRAGIGDIVRHFTLRGYDVGCPVGSRYFSVEPAAPPKMVQRAGGFSFHNFLRPGR